jgi:hypothetical protein
MKPSVGMTHTSSICCNTHRIRVPPSGLLNQPSNPKSRRRLENIQASGLSTLVHALVAHKHISVPRRACTSASLTVVRLYNKFRDNVSNAVVTVKVLGGVVSLSTICMTFPIQKGMHVAVTFCRWIIFICNWYADKKLHGYRFKVR